MIKNIFIFLTMRMSGNKWIKWGIFIPPFSYLLSASRLAMERCKSKRKSDLIGTITSFAVMSSIEVLDGFSSGYGASVSSDLVANAMGAGFYLGQQALWHETRIYPKFSFIEHPLHHKDLTPWVRNGLSRRNF
jgi:hypothetical protein